MKEVMESQRFILEYYEKLGKIFLHVHQNAAMYEWEMALSSYT